MQGELKGGSGGTCHNDKPGRNDGYGGSRYDDEGGVRGEAGGRVRLATVASRVMCLRRWKPDKEKDGSDGEEEGQRPGGPRIYLAWRSERGSQEQGG